MKKTCTLVLVAIASARALVLDTATFRCLPFTGAQFAAPRSARLSGTTVQPFHTYNCMMVPGWRGRNLIAPITRVRSMVLLLSSQRCRSPAMARTLIVAALVLGCLAMATAQPCIECNVSDRLQLADATSEQGNQHPSTPEAGLPVC